MRIIDKYILTSILKVFLTTVLIFCFMYVLIDITSHLDEYIDRDVPLKTLALYYMYFFPVILVQTSSIACLISVLLTYSTLSNNNEVIAMRSSGLTFFQITKPALIFGLIISALVFWMNERFVPQANAETKKIEDESMILEADRFTRENTKIKNLTFYGINNRLYYVDTYDPATEELYGITIIENDEDQDIVEKTVALKGVWTGIAWKFYETQVTEYGSGGINDPVKVKVYEEKLMDIPESPEDFVKQRVQVDAMNSQQLKDYIERFKNSGAATAINNLRVDYHQKLAYPIGNFVIVFAGLPFVLMLRNRKGLTFTSIGLAMLLGFLYYVTNAVAIAFGKGGWLPPILSAWTAPFLFLGAAICAIEAKF